MNHQGIKFSAYFLALLFMVLVFILDMTLGSKMRFLLTIFSIPVGLLMIFLGTIYSYLYKRKNELPQISVNLLKSCYIFFLIGSLWLIWFTFFRGLLDSDFHFFSNQLLIKNLKKYLFYLIIGFQIIAFVSLLLFDIIKTGEHPKPY